eukprot:477402_1
MGCCCSSSGYGFSIDDSDSELPFGTRDKAEPLWGQIHEDIIGEYEIKFNNTPWRIETVKIGYYKTDTFHWIGKYGRAIQYTHPTINCIKPVINEEYDYKCVGNNTRNNNEILPIGKVIFSHVGDHIIKIDSIEPEGDANEYSINTTESSNYEYYYSKKDNKPYFIQVVIKAKDITCGYMRDILMTFEYGFPEVLVELIVMYFV